jgi:hypothetical protein
MDLSSILQIEYSFCISTNFTLRIYTPQELLVSTISLLFERARYTDLSVLYGEIRSYIDYGMISAQIFKNYSMIEITMASIYNGLEQNGLKITIIKLTLLCGKFSIDIKRVKNCIKAMHSEIYPEKATELALSPMNNILKNVNSWVPSDIQESISTENIDASSPLSTKSLNTDFQLINLIKETPDCHNEKKFISKKRLWKSQSNIINQSI